MQTPRSPFDQVGGMVYFARMLDRYAFRHLVGCTTIFEKISASASTVAALAICMSIMPCSSIVSLKADRMKRF
jgi:hypothetical protein